MQCVVTRSVTLLDYYPSSTIVEKSHFSGEFPFVPTLSFQSFYVQS